jgi:hypothetical protein
VSEDIKDLGDRPIAEVQRLLDVAIANGAVPVVDPDPDDPEGLIVRAIAPGPEGRPEIWLEAHLDALQVEALMRGDPLPNPN